MGPRLPVRVRFGEWRGTPLPYLPDDVLEVYAAFVSSGPLRLAPLREQDLRENSDRSGPRQQRAA